MLKYILRRLLMVIPVFLGISLIVFLIMSFTPGDPIVVMLGFTATDPSVVAKTREELGLDQPLPVQYGLFLWRLAQGNLGRDLFTGRSVIEEIAETWPRTLALAVLALAWAVPAGMALGIFAARRQGSIFDNFSTVTSLFAASLPNFWLALVLILIFSYYLKIFPIAGFGWDFHVVLPVLALGASPLGTISRLSRSSMLEVIRQDYVRAARARGLVERVVIYQHALNNALIPIVTVVGIYFGHMLVGAFFVEVVFAWPGMGRLLVDAVSFRNYTVVQGTIFVTSVIFVLVNILVDIIYAYVDPRVQLE